MRLFDGFIGNELEMVGKTTDVNRGGKMSGDNCSPVTIPVFHEGSGRGVVFVTDDPTVGGQLTKVSLFEAEDLALQTIVLIMEDASLDIVCQRAFVELLHERIAVRFALIVGQSVAVHEVVGCAMEDLG